MKNKKKNVNIKKLILMTLITLGCFLSFQNLFLNNHIEEYNVDGLSIQHQFLTINPYSRSGQTLYRVNGIVIHYTANPGSSAQNNHDYFESLKYKHTASVSSHFIIGIHGEIIQCIPLNEISYASNNRNKDTISIECCHLDESGQLTEATYQSLVELVHSLKNTYHLKQNDIIRHYDVTGKNCPKYFVEHEDAWQQFLKDVNMNEFS